MVVRADTGAAAPATVQPCPGMMCPIPIDAVGDPLVAPARRVTSPRTFVFLVVGDRTADHPKPLI